MGRACSFSSTSIWHSGSSWAPPSRYISQCSTTGDRQVTFITRELSHTVHLHCVVNVASACFQIYGLFYGQTDLCLVMEPDCTSKAANQGRVWKNNHTVACLSLQLVHECTITSICLSRLFLSDFIAPTFHVFQVGGLQLEGCSYDGVCLSENQHNSPSVSAVPTCYMAWVLQVCLCSNKFVY